MYIVFYSLTFWEDFLTYISIVSHLIIALQSFSRICIVQYYTCNYNTRLLLYTRVIQLSNCQRNYRRVSYPVHSMDIKCHIANNSSDSSLYIRMPSARGAPFILRGKSLPRIFGTESIPTNSIVVVFSITVSIVTTDRPEQSFAPHSVA